MIQIRSILPIDEVDFDYDTLALPAVDLTRRKVGLSSSMRLGKEILTRTTSSLLSISIMSIFGYHLLISPFSQRFNSFADRLEQSEELQFALLTILSDHPVTFEFLAKYYARYDMEARSKKAQKLADYLNCRKYRTEEQCKEIL